VAKSFRLIEENTKTVYVLTEAPKLAGRLRRGERSRELFRELQKYGVSLYESDFLKIGNRFERLDEEVSILTIPEFYSEKYGISLAE
jgi:CRISPR-associated endonuclease/helicase Cas3